MVRAVSEEAVRDTEALHDELDVLRKKVEQLERSDKKHRDWCKVYKERQKRQRSGGDDNDKQ